MMETDKLADDRFILVMSEFLCFKVSLHAWVLPLYVVIHKSQLKSD